MPWVREGECPPERCRGRCCEHAGIWFDQDDAARQFLAMLQFRGVTILEGGGKYLADVPIVCRYLERGLCKLHPDMAPDPGLPPRPVLCDEWPTDPSQLVADTQCGFRFRWEDD